ncbi:MAG: hypothetical protein N4A45_03175 [Flavobacteriales bacterium]|jgi:hypothetical protein|nr:hypothetical protein [Flavobacteriales bacterium]
MKKGLKYFISIALILSCLGMFMQGQVLQGLISGLLGAMILPPLVEIIKDKVPLWNKNGVRYITYFMMLMLIGISTGIHEQRKSKTPKSIITQYIKSNPQDKHMKNVIDLVEVSNLFGGNNQSLVYPQQDGEFKDQKMEGVSFKRYYFNPKIDFTKAQEFLIYDKEKGYMDDYLIMFEIDSLGTIFNIQSIIKYNNTVRTLYGDDVVPDISQIMDLKIVENQRVKRKQELQEIAERKKMNEIMGDGDFWNLYDPMVKTRVYKLIIEKDCKKLQVEFNTAADMQERKHKSGMSASKEVDLMDFINNKMSDIGCYNGY